MPRGPPTRGRERAARCARSHRGSPARPRRGARGRRRAQRRPRAGGSRKPPPGTWPSRPRGPRAAIARAAARGGRARASTRPPPPRRGTAPAQAPATGSASALHRALLPVDRMKIWRHTICMHTKRKAPAATASDTALRRLRSQIALNREFRGGGEAAFLALAWTWQRLEALGRDFFPRYGITDVQFNVLMILWDYRERLLRQHELAELLVVNRASAGGVIARLERAGWISRKVDPGDTRARLVRLTRAGIAKLEE